MRILYIAALLFSVTGFAKGDGDRVTLGKGSASNFIINKTIEYGGKPSSIEVLPEITNPWSYAEDEYGCVIRFSPNSYESIRKLLYLAYGKPSIGPDKVQGGLLGVYRLTPKGGAIQFGVDGDITQVVIMRPPGLVNNEKP